MTNILSAEDLADLSVLFTLPEEFGPGSDRPYLAFALADADPSLADRLRLLPCPVIGIGAGPLAPACDVVLADAHDLPPIDRNVRATPLAAMILVQHLRASEHLDMASALTAESLAYATVQQGPEFKRQSFYRFQPTPNSEPHVEIHGTESSLNLTLNRPASLNAINVAMRDALSEALDIALADSDAPSVHIASTGRCFSSGGEVSEFGLASDPATAHWVRTLRLLSLIHI